MSFYIYKASAEKELFDIEKFKRSLRSSGAKDALIEKIADEIQQLPELRSTKDIYTFAFNYLKKHSPPIAARYNIRSALEQLGPSGFPFEKFVAALFAEQDYTVHNNQIVEGRCVSHEIDVTAAKDKKKFMIECKFHVHGIKTDVKVTLYIKARFEDIEQALQEDHKRGHKFDQAWIVSNAKFTSEAIQYAQCVGIKLLGWSYPHDNSIQHLIDKLQLHPITALVSLTNAQKKAFIKEGLVLCKDAARHKDILKRLGFTPGKIEAFLRETEAVCKL